MVSKHVKRDWTDHKKEVIRPDEYIKVEIFSFDHQYSRFYPANKKYAGENLKQVSHRHMKCYEAADNSLSNFVVEMDYPVKKVGDYRIDILYETKDSTNYVGAYSFTQNNAKYLRRNVKPRKRVLKTKAAKNKTNKKVKVVYEKDSKHKLKGADLLFDGEKNFIKRKTIFTTIREEGNYKLAVELPLNCYFIGAVIRNVITLTGDNKDSEGSALGLLEADISASNMINPSELTFNILYDPAFDNPLSQSGYYMDYRDEVNVYVKEDGNLNNNKTIRRFGGYISSFNLDEDKTNLSISCADRLIDGETKFILDAFVLLGGTTLPSEMEYLNPINFKNYGHVLKFLCNVHETTLISNIKQNFLVAGEKYHEGLSLKFGKKKDIKKVIAKNSTAKVNKNFITVRNNADGKVGQSIVLYDAKTAGAKKPILLKRISNGKVKEEYLTFHMTYGLGKAKQTKESTVVQNVKSSGGSSSQKFGKCGVTSDGKYIMAIGTPTSAKDSGHYGTYYKTVFKNYCPHCGGNKLRWDSCRSDTKCVYTQGWNGSKRSWGGGIPPIETEITCNNGNCDCDYSALGNEKDSPWYKLQKVSQTVTSSKAEQDKLHRGEMVANPFTASAITPQDIINEIGAIARKYRYKLGVSSTYSDMKKTGVGDCYAFSDLLFTEFKKRGVAVKIYHYSSSSSPSGTHRSVMYLNANKKWVHFPYADQGLSNNLNPIPANMNLKDYYKYYKGSNIGRVTVSTGSKSSTKTTKVTKYYNYDKDNPYQAYIEITYSTSPSFKAKKKKVRLDFTQKAGSKSDWSGLTNYWIYNTMKQTSVSLSGFFLDNEPNKNIYLHTIRFVTPKIKPKDKKENTDWFTMNDSTKDYASRKMDLYQIIFDNGQVLNPLDLQSCGKSVNALMEEIITQSGYYVNMEYGLHRKDDKILFRVDNETEARFKATEGDDNNILEWTNINYTPISTLRNKSICVFKDSSGKYKYVDTGDLNSMLQYGEQTTLQTQSEQMGEKQAYFNARNSAEFNPEQSYSYSIIVPYAPYLRIKDLVQVVSNSKKLNDVKPVESWHIKYSHSAMPSIHTELGLDELEPLLHLKKEMQTLRANAKKETTSFSSTAQAIDDDELYIWDR